MIDGNDVVLGTQDGWMTGRKRSFVVETLGLYELMVQDQVGREMGKGSRRGKKD